MREKTAKKQLRKMLRHFTAGSILALLAEIFEEDAEEARQESDPRAYQRLRSVESTLVVVGMGVDAACPRG
jgi:hypothetical protein